MSQNAVINHISSRIRADVEFLVSEGLMSQYDANQVIAKLPSAAASSAPTSRAVITPPPSTFSTPSTERTQPGFKRNPPPPPPPVQSAPAYQQARAVWSYNEDGADPNDLSFAAGDLIDIIEETNADWWKGRMNGREGLFPSNYVEKVSSSPNKAAPPSYAGASAPVSEKQQPTYGTARFVPPPPPQGYSHYPHPTPSHHPGQQPPQTVVVEAPEKKSKFGGLGKTMGTAAAGGVGFGAGAAIGSGIVNAIF